MRRTSTYIGSRTAPGDATRFVIKDEVEMLRRTLLVVTGMLLFACGSSGAASSPGGGVGGNYGQPGCTSDPDCSKCSGCLATCVCSTGDQAQCRPACGISGSGGGGGQPATGPLAAGLAISQISVYQGVEIPIEKQGNDIANRNAPVVQGRPAMVRVFVNPASGFQSRDIIAQLELSGAAPQQLKHTVNGASAPGNLQSTFNFEVPADAIKGNTQYAVTLLEAGGSGQGSTSGARYPAAGMKNLGARSTSGTLKVLLVPMIVNGITPDTSAGRVTAYHDRLMQLYPITNVEINVRKAYNYGGSISANGSGWGNALQALQSLRQQDNVSTKVYYYGVLTPNQSLSQYCGFGCVAGLGSVPQPDDVYQRGSIGLGFFPQGGSSQTTGDSPTTMAHELGHALGRNHAPCAPAGSPLTGVDSGYPYSGGAIGSWGWNIQSHQLRNPNQYKDVMGYCQPTWISDYNYRSIFDRIAYVNSHGYVVPPSDADRSGGQFAVAVVEPDGTLQWGIPVRMDPPVMGEVTEITTVDASGLKTGSVVGFYTPFADLPGGQLFVRESSLRLPDVHGIVIKKLGPAVLPL